jgi:hypothetical protein
MTEHEPDLEHDPLRDLVEWHLPDRPVRPPSRPTDEARRDGS